MISQIDLVKEFFIYNPNRDIPHQESVAWLLKEHLKRNKTVFADPDRAIRKLHQQGFLIKVGKGIYRYDPSHVIKRHLEEFTEVQKKVIKERDGYKCVVCGKGIKDGVELHVDHIKPKDFGGKATIENGQTLCGPHNYLKKKFNQTETGKRMFIRLYKLAKFEANYELLDFCTQILEVFERNNVNGHIIWHK